MPAPIVKKIFLDLANIFTKTIPLRVSKIKVANNIRYRVKIFISVRITNGVCK